MVIKAVSLKTKYIKLKNKQTNKQQKEEKKNNEFFENNIKKVNPVHLEIQHFKQNYFKKGRQGRNKETRERKKKEREKIELENKYKKKEVCSNSHCKSHQDSSLFVIFHDMSSGDTLCYECGAVQQSKGFGNMETAIIYNYPHQKPYQRDVHFEEFLKQLEGKDPEIEPTIFQEFHNFICEHYEELIQTHGEMTYWGPKIFSNIFTSPEFVNERRQDLVYDIKIILEHWIQIRKKMKIEPNQFIILPSERRELKALYECIALNFEEMLKQKLLDRRNIYNLNYLTAILLRWLNPRPKNYLELCRFLPQQLSNQQPANNNDSFLKLIRYINGKFESEKKEIHFIDRKSNYWKFKLTEEKIDGSDIIDLYSFFK